MPNLKCNSKTPGIYKSVFNIFIHVSSHPDESSVMIHEICQEFMNCFMSGVCHHDICCSV